MDKRRLVAGSAASLFLIFSFTTALAASDSTPPTSSDNWTATEFVSDTSILVEINASDSNSSVANISYRVNGGNWSTVPGNSTEVTIDTQGNNTLEYNATDTEGNIESVNTEYVALDTTAPVWQNLESNVTTPELTYTPGAKLNFSVEVNDSLSGVSEVNVYVNDTGSYRDITAKSDDGGWGGGPGGG